MRLTKKSRTSIRLTGFGVFSAALAFVMFAVPAMTQDIGHPDPEVLEELYPGKTYSPYAQRSFPSKVYWGETHLHTGLSLDAGLFGNTLGLEEAYRFARGEEVTSASGLPVKLARPLDWLVIADHSDMMGFALDLQRGAPHILADPKGREWYEGFQEGGEAAGMAAFDLITNFTQMTFPEELAKHYAPDGAVYAGVWDKNIAAAERFNEPGRFTALIGFEWTSIPQGNNLHRNVILRDNGDRARQVIPLTTQPPLGTTDPLDLYQWLEDYEANTGGQALAIAHNGNLSNGWMFPTEDTYAGGTVDQNYVELRAKWEPLYEVTQIKGDGEAHPALSPNDEFADYGTWDKANLDLTALKKPDMLQREYAREALKQGLALEEEFGTNPYKFGMVGATDSHTSLSTAEEDNFFGKSTSVEPSATRVQHPFASSDLGVWEGYGWLPPATRECGRPRTRAKALFDAMERKETYATTGPRIAVRFFGGWDFDDNDLRSRQPAFLGYEKGVPMGSDLTMAPSGKAPTFMVYACAIPSAPISTASRSSRVGWTRAARRRRGSTTSRCRTVARLEPTAAARRRSATPSTSKPRTGPTPSALPSSPPSGPTRISIRTESLLLRPDPGDPDATLGAVRQGPPRRGDSGRGGVDPPGTSLHLAHLVHALSEDSSTRIRAAV